MVVKKKNLKKNLLHRKMEINIHVCNENLWQNEIEIHFFFIINTHTHTHKKDNIEIEISNKQNVRRFCFDDDNDDDEHPHSSVVVVVVDDDNDDDDLTPCHFNFISIQFDSITSE